MPAKALPFQLYFEIIFLEIYERLEAKEKKIVDKAKNVQAKYEIGRSEVFIAYASKDLRITFEYGPEPGMIAIRNCGHHDSCERKI